MSILSNSVKQHDKDEKNHQNYEVKDALITIYPATTQVYICDEETSEC